MTKVCRVLRASFAAVCLLAGWQVGFGQNACTVNCGDKCTRVALGVQYRDPLCYSTCEGEKAACPLTGGAILPDFGAVPSNLAKTACGLPHGVTLHYINSVCGFVANSPLDALRIEAAKHELIRFGLVRSEEFNDVSIFFCDSIHGSGVVPERDRIFLHSRHRTSGTTYLASLLAHEIEHVRQYRIHGTDNFKCTYTRQVGDCLASNLERGLSNLLRDGFCQTRDKNDFERRAYDFEATAQRILNQPPPHPDGTGKRESGDAKSAALTGPRAGMFCQIGKALGYCKVVAQIEGESCSCRRDRVPGPAGTPGLTRALGRTTINPGGEPWD